MRSGLIPGRPVVAAEDVTPAGAVNQIQSLKLLAAHRTRTTRTVESFWCVLDVMRRVGGNGDWRLAGRVLRTSEPLTRCKEAFPMRAAPATESTGLCKPRRQNVQAPATDELGTGDRKAHV